MISAARADGVLDSPPEGAATVWYHHLDRVGYSLAALAPDRITAIAALALAYQPRGAFVMPDFSQARAFWYQWLMYVDAGAEAIRRDPVAFARKQWNTWSPPGWFDDHEFAATAEAFRNPDWTAITPTPIEAASWPMNHAITATTNSGASLERSSVSTFPRS
jgi:hypothetical protein